MRRVQLIDNMIKQTRLKFVLFTVLGGIIVAVLSMATLRYHRSIIAQQDSLQKLYRNISEQHALVQEIALLGETLGKTSDRAAHARMRTELSQQVQRLSRHNAQLRALLHDDAAEPFAGPKEERALLHLENHLQGYLQRADLLAARPYNRRDEARADAAYLSARSREDLADSLGKLSDKASAVNRQHLANLNRLGVLLVGLCVLEVILVWVLVFRPLYRTIRVQHEKLSEAVMLSHSASRAKTDFLANISHEIRTPMTAILGYAERLNREGDVTLAERREAVQIINNNASHLLALVDEILDVAKIEAGAITLNAERVDLRTLLGEVFALLQVKAAEKEIRLIFTEQGEPAGAVRTDPQRLKQILFNIVGNAVKFTQQGEVRVTTSCSRGDGKAHLEFLVADTGPGIAPDKLNRLFKPFQQAAPSPRRRYGISGLGLVLSRELARAMGGDVTIVRTSPGEGTTFRVALLAGLEHEKVAEHLPPAHPESKDALAGARLLVVDDARENARLFQMNLAAAGASVDVAGGGDEALDLARNGAYHLVLLDLQMPGKDGFQVLRELRQGGYRGVVVALTAHAMEEERRKTRQAGFDGHITKPIPSGQLVATVSDFLPRAGV